MKSNFFMNSICFSLHYSISLTPYKALIFTTNIISNRRIHRVQCNSMDDGDASAPLDYDASELLGLDVDIQRRKVIPGAAKLRSWFGPNGQYIRELPCPSCRGRGYTQCTECCVERSRSDCSQCNGKGIMTCQQCLGDCVIWEESIDERPWEKAQSSSHLKMKEDDEVDKMEIKVVNRKSKRIYQSPSLEVSQKISRSLKSLNAKTGLFSKRMKIIHQDPVLRAQRAAAIKKSKGTAEARKQTSEFMKAFFSNPENRLKRSIAMKGVKFYCSHCGEEGHRKHYCPKLRVAQGKLKLSCRLCGERGHNIRTCGKLRSNEEAKRIKQSNPSRFCGLCNQNGHNRRTCPDLAKMKVSSNLISHRGTSTSHKKKIYSCRLCLGKGHNTRTCPNKKEI